MHQFKHLICFLCPVVNEIWICETCKSLQSFFIYIPHSICHLAGLGFLVVFFYFPKELRHTIIGREEEMHALYVQHGNKSLN